LALFRKERKERNKIEPKCGNFSSFLYSSLSGFIVVNPVNAGWSAPVASAQQHCGIGYSHVNIYVNI